MFHQKQQRIIQLFWEFCGYNTVVMLKYDRKQHDAIRKWGIRRK